MCTVSMIAQDWHQRHPYWVPNPILPNEVRPDPFDFKPQNPPDLSQLFVQPITRAEFDELKKELAAIKDLLKAAKKYDEDTGQKDCEDPEKVALFRRLAQIAGISMDDVFPSAPAVK